MQQASIRATCDDLHQLRQPATADLALATLLGDDARWFGWSPEGRLRCTLSQHEFPIRAEHVAGLVAVAQSQDASLLESRCDSSQQSQPQQSQPQLSQEAWSQQQWRSVRQHVRSKAFAAAAAVAEAMERAAPHIVACPHDSTHLQCALTGSTIARTAAAIRRHTAGHRFQAALARLEPEKAAAQRLDQWQQAIGAQQQQQQQQQQQGLAEQAVALQQWCLPDNTCAVLAADGRDVAHAPLQPQQPMASIQSQQPMASLQSQQPMPSIHSHAMHGPMEGTGVLHVPSMNEDQPMRDDTPCEASPQKRTAVGSVGPRFNAPRHKKR